MVRSLSECEERYGKIENGVWVGESQWCSLFHVPALLGLSWVNSVTGKPMSKIYANKDMHQPLLNALNRVYLLIPPGQLQTFDGCFHIRDVRGEPGKPSVHSYGLAIDVNASQNPLGSPSKLSPEFVKCFTDEGFAWGGNFSRLDPMHFSYGWE